MTDAPDPINDLRSQIKSQSQVLRRLAGYAAARERRQLLAALEPQRLEHWGRKVYSQSDEDGILAEILSRVATTSAAGIFIEFGVEDGLQNNTHLLLRQGFAGIWIEQAATSVKWIQRSFEDYLASGQLMLAEELLAPDTIDARLAALSASRRVAVLSIDVDGNDYWLWSRLESIRPAVVIIEYNGTFPPPLSIVQEFTEGPPRKIRTDYFGASLSALVALGAQKGYELVACNLTGVNAFFVRADLVTAERFPYARTAEALYHPLRRDLVEDLFRGGYAPAVGRYVTV